MRENFIFENHLGQRFVGLDNGVYMNYNDLRDYSWSYDTINSRISRFHMAVRNRKIPLVVCCDSEDEAIKVKNRLLELAEADINAVLPGRIYVGKYYTTGYITASAKSDYLITKRLCKLELTLTSDDPAWYREQTYSFQVGKDNNTAVSGGTDYPYDYPYDYAASLTGGSIFCDTVGSNAFRLTIYGEITDPTILIGGHTYTVKGSVGVGEILVVDSLTKTITLTNRSGKKVNWFDNRGRDSYIFEPIPAGQNLVSWSGNFGFELTVIEKRSEPRWI